MESKIVIDASAALKWQFRDETDAENAVNMLLDYEGEKVGIPDSVGLNRGKAMLYCKT